MDLLVITVVGIILIVVVAIAIAFIRAYFIFRKRKKSIQSRLKNGTFLSNDGLNQMIERLIYLENSTKRFEEIIELSDKIDEKYSVTSGSNHYFQTKISKAKALHLLGKRDWNRKNLEDAERILHDLRGINEYRKYGSQIDTMIKANETQMVVISDNSSYE